MAPKEQTPDQSSTEGKGITAAQAAKLVKREVPVMEKGKPTGKTRQVAVKTEEVLDFADRGDHVIVVTTDGQKLRGDK